MAETGEVVEVVRESNNEIEYQVRILNKAKNAIETTQIVTLKTYLLDIETFNKLRNQANISKYIEIDLGKIKSNNIEDLEKENPMGKVDLGQHQLAVDEAYTELAKIVFGIQASASRIVTEDMEPLIEKCKELDLLKLKSKTAKKNTAM